MTTRPCPQFPLQIVIAVARRVASVYVVTPHVERYIGNEAADLYDAQYEFATPTGCAGIATALRRGHQAGRYTTHVPVVLAVDTGAGQLSALRDALLATALPHHLLALGVAGVTAPATTHHTELALVVVGACKQPGNWRFLR